MTTWKNYEGVSPLFVWSRYELIKLQRSLAWKDNGERESRVLSWSTVLSKQVIPPRLLSCRSVGAWKGRMHVERYFLGWRERNGREKNGERRCGAERGGRRGGEEREVDFSLSLSPRRRGCHEDPTNFGGWRGHDASAPGIDKDRERRLG